MARRTHHVDPPPPPEPEPEPEPEPVYDDTVGQEPAPPPEPYVDTSPPITEPVSSETPKTEGLFKFKEGFTVEGRRFLGDMRTGQAMCEWCGRGTVQQFPNILVVKVMQGAGELVVYPGDWLIRLDNDYIVFSEEALNGRLEEA